MALRLAGCLGWRAAEPREFYEDFEFPIIQFTDKVLYRSDKQQLAGFENSYLLYMWHRRIMTGRPRRLRIPWRSYPEEVATLRDQRRLLMRRSLGREVPAPDLALE